MNKELTPVVVVGYSRAGTLRRSLGNLAKCHGLGDRDLYFFQDAPCRSADIPKVEAMYQVALEMQNTILPHLIIVRRERNFGIPENLLAAVREVMDNYGRLIFFEDDVLVSRTFLEYMDNALETYRNDQRIFCINAYAKDLKVYKGYPFDVYLTPRNSAWGWASWRDRWDRVDFSLKGWPELRADQDFQRRLYAAGCDLNGLAEATYCGKVKTWDVQCSVHMVLNKMFAIEPRLSLTRNIGFGVDGINCCRWNNEPRKKYYNFTARLPRGIMPDPRILDGFKYTDMDDRLVFWFCRGIKKRLRALLPPAFEEPQDC